MGGKLPEIVGSCSVEEDPEAWVLPQVSKSQSLHLSNGSLELMGGFSVLTNSFNRVLSSTYYMPGPGVGKRNTGPGLIGKRHYTMNFSECKINVIINAKKQK